MEAASEAFKNKTKRIATSKLNDILLPIIKASPPTYLQRKTISIKYITQLPVAFPAFVFYCNLPQYIREPYKRFVENNLRKHFGFTGNPVQIYFRKKIGLWKTFEN